MADEGTISVSIDEFRAMADRAGLGLSPEEVEELKPIYEMYLPHIRALHSIDFKAEEIGLAFHPDWPQS